MRTSALLQRLRFDSPTTKVLDTLEFCVDGRTFPRQSSQMSMVNKLMILFGYSHTLINVLLI